MTRKVNKSSVFKFLKDNVMYLVLLVLIIIFSTQTSNFLTPQNLINVVNQCAYLIVVGVGIALIMLGGAMDLSVGYQMSVLAVVMGIMARDGASTVQIILVALVLGVALSTLNGVIYAKLEVFPFIITLATQYLFYGASYLLSKSKTFKNFDPSFKFIGSFKLKIAELQLPVGIIVMILAVCVGAFILNKTYFGRNIYALGSNPEAVALSGVSVPKMRIAIFAIAGFFFALGTIMTVGRVGSASSGTGVGAEFTVMAGAMLGGIKMGGGGGKMSNMVVGMLILQLLSNGMDLMQLNTYWQNEAMGLVLLIAITIDTIQSNSVVKKSKVVVGKPPAEELKPPVADESNPPAE
jgi:ribose/xylose/arabinose/galactoside ABC-type transport system permease subunit